MRNRFIATVSALALALPVSLAMADQPEPEMGSEAGVEASQSGDTGMSATSRGATAGEAGNGVSDAELDEIVGLSVESVDGEELGTVEEVVVDPMGQAEVIIESNGFLGLGREQTAVSVEDIDVDEANDLVIVRMTRDQFESLPEHENGETMQ